MSPYVDLYEVREDGLSGFQVIEQKRFIDSPREITKKNIKASYGCCTLHIV